MARYLLLFLGKMEPQAQELDRNWAHGKAAPGTGFRPWLIRAAVVAVVACVLLLVVRWQGEERRAVAALPELDRRALYTRTLENLAKACASPPEGLRDYCEGQARLAVEFAECDGKCQALAKPHLERIPRR